MDRLGTATGVVESMQALLVAERERMQAELTAAGSPEAWLRQRLPLLSATCPSGLGEADVVAGTLACFEDAEKRLGECQLCQAPDRPAPCERSYGVFTEGQVPIWDGNHQVQRQPCERWREYALRRRLRVSRVPSRHTVCSLQSFEPRTVRHDQALGQVYQFVEHVCSGGPDWILIHGRQGSGKTHLGCAILRALLRRLRGVHMLYVDLPSLRTALRTHQFDSAEAEPTAELRQTDVLVLDNVMPAGPKDGWVYERIEDALYERWTEQRTTVLLTREQPATLVAMFNRLTTLSEVAPCSLE